MLNSLLPFYAAESIIPLKTACLPHLQNLETGILFMPLLYISRNYVRIDGILNLNSSSIFADRYILRLTSAMPVR